MWKEIERGAESFASQTEWSIGPSGWTPPPPPGHSEPDTSYLQVTQRATMSGKSTPHRHSTVITGVFATGIATVISTSHHSSRHNRHATLIKMGRTASLQSPPPRPPATAGVPHTLTHRADQGGDGPRGSGATASPRARAPAGLRGAPVVPGGLRGAVAGRAPSWWGQAGPGRLATAWCGRAQAEW